jgi:hypothetical protein
MSKRSSRTPQAASPALIEVLERRNLLSATIEGHVILVVGTNGDDEISVNLNPSDSSKVDVTENGVTSTFDKAGRERVRIFASYGDDVIEIGDDLGLKVQAFGQRGDDELFGGNQRELLVGGHGDDFLSGGPKFDWLMGMQGEDEFDGADQSREYADLTTEDGVVIELEDAPEAVHSAVLDLLDGAEIEKLIREDDEGLVFELEWEDTDGGPHSAKIRPNGDVVELESEIDIEELPEAVVSGIVARYPGGEITEAETLAIPGQPLAYEVEVVVRRTIREIIVTPAGEILQDEVEGYIETSFNLPPV